MHGILLAFIAGCATGIGVLPVLWMKSYKPTSLAAGMSLAAGVMAYLTFVEIHPEVVSTFEEAYVNAHAANPQLLTLITTIGTFFVGWLIADLVNFGLHWVFRENRQGVTPDKNAKSNGSTNPIVSPSLAAFEAQVQMQMKPTEEAEAGKTEAPSQCSIDELSEALAEEAFRRDHLRLLRVGWFTALALSLHNLPEGIATFTGATSNAKLAVAITAAIAIHNIPEGLAVAIPIYYSTRRPKYAVLVATATGMAEPIGAFLAWAIIGSSPSPVTYGIMLGLVCGIMMNVALKELFYGAARYDPCDKISTKMFLLGMAIIAISLILLELTLPE
eukprot:Protomagalhaensia_wolfi_Nauph_80__4865@NODE_50_length_4187_cov_153_098843_g41_i0_p2_GENE_NODE_50_length_4187_cov_153_098843_g41_i0NODE_50_length_4187_cov_153_098843_g41_i0_p2_ORF_typecomplete_len331_score40_14Zip/PF02535_22/1_2e43TMEM144/PF07857_12/0_071TMEM144/PF07857_12/14DUF2407_C/PF13373_6/30DUF2407_C/PF13373_6/46_NODE_50_length_4187_cov_153_098843_g41_i016782670